MGIRIVKQGILDTIQDGGRYGYQHWGINPGGAADKVAFTMANLLVGNNINNPAIEMYYPAAGVQFEEDMLIAITGADFGAVINGVAVPLNTPVLAAANSVVQFTKHIKGNCCYLSANGFVVFDDWLGSYATNLTAGAGGYKGRKILTGDVIPFSNNNVSYTNLLAGKAFASLGFKTILPGAFPAKPVLRVIAGAEYGQLTNEAQNLLIHSSFTVTHDSDKMGCRLAGIPLQLKDTGSMVSSGVTAGTVQLLPNGQLVVLSAEHQTTGGYPRVANVISADLHLLAQLQPNEHIQFTMITINEAEELLLEQHNYLRQLQLACRLRLTDYFTKYAKS